MRFKREAVNRLSQEYGEPLHIHNADGGKIQLGVLEAGAGKVSHLLSPKESERLAARLHQITIEIIQRTLEENRDEPWKNNSTATRLFPYPWEARGGKSSKATPTR
jgi:hypothetical protein